MSLRLASFLRFGLLAMAGGVVGCATSDGYRYRDLFILLDRMEVRPDRLEALPVSLIDAETGEPARGARLIVDTEPAPRVLPGDASGQVLIPVEPGLRRENPPIRIEPPEARVRLVATLSGSLSGREIASVSVRSAAGRRRMGDAQVAVFYGAGETALARKVRAGLIRSRAVVRSITGLEPPRWAVLIEPGPREANVLYLTVPPPGYESGWLCFREEWDSGDFLDVNPHEWAEATLTSAFGLYDDPRNRFIGDGLAELVAWRVNGLPPDYGDRLSPEQVGDRETVDLLSAFQVVPGRVFHRRRIERGLAKHGYVPGYALAFAFWHELYEAHGPGLTAAYVRELSRRPQVKAEEAIAILARLTGDETVGERIRAASVAAARLRIAGLIRRGRGG